MWGKRWEKFFIFNHSTYFPINLFAKLKKVVYPRYIGLHWECKKWYIQATYSSWGCYKVYPFFKKLHFVLNLVKNLFLKQNPPRLKKFERKNGKTEVNILKSKFYQNHSKKVVKSPNSTIKWNSITIEQIVSLSPRWRISRIPGSSKNGTSNSIWQACRNM